MPLDALPEELQAECTIYLGVTSAGRFGQVNKACKELVDEKMPGILAARDRAVLEKVSSRWCEALAATWRSADGSNLIKFPTVGQRSSSARARPTRSAASGWARGRDQPGAPPWVAPALEALAPRRLWRGTADDGGVASLCRGVAGVPAPRLRSRVSVGAALVAGPWAGML